MIRPSCPPLRLPDKSRREAWSHDSKRVYVKVFSPLAGQDCPGPRRYSVSVKSPAYSPAWICRRANALVDIKTLDQFIERRKQ